MPNLKYGTDPEFFTVINDGNFGKVISPAMLEMHGKIVALNNDIKHPVYIDTREYSWMGDGVAFELTLKNPQESAKQLHNIVEISLEHLEEFISKLDLEGEKISLIKKPVVGIDPLMYLPHIHSNEKLFMGFIFGCDEDFDAIDTGYKCKVLDVEKHPFRYAGGHIHISGHHLLDVFTEVAIKLLAIYVGNYVIKNSVYKDLDQMRGQTYGRPGRYRPQKYSNGDVGVEYRTPSNSWLSFPLDRKEELFYLADKAVYLLDSEKEAVEILNTYLDKTIKNIVNVDSDGANDVLQSLT